MKKAIIVIIMLLALVAGVCAGVASAEREARHEAERNTYALTCEVVEVDRVRDVVTCEDYNGNLWEFYGCEDWQTGDCASLLMDSRGTESVHDDTITHARYSGWTLNK
jgi:hypothetical protein